MHNRDGYSDLVPGYYSPFIPPIGIGLYAVIGKNALGRRVIPD
jgi:hypothetical protein